MSIDAHDPGMPTIDRYLDDQLRRGRTCSSGEQALSALGSTPVALSAVLTRQIRKGRLPNPRQSFYIVPRPEGQTVDAAPEDGLSRFVAARCGVPWSVASGGDSLPDHRAETDAQRSLASN